MANLNINKLQSPYLRAFFQDIFDGTTALEGLSVQDSKTTNPISFTTSAPVNGVAAQGTLTFSDSVSDTETVTIGTDVYEFDTDASVTEGNILTDMSAAAVPEGAGGDGAVGPRQGTRGDQAPPDQPVDLDVAGLNG